MLAALPPGDTLPQHFLGRTENNTKKRLSIFNSVADTIISRMEVVNLLLIDDGQVPRVSRNCTRSYLSDFGPKIE